MTEPVGGDPGTNEPRDKGAPLEPGQGGFTSHAYRMRCKKEWKRQSHMRGQHMMHTDVPHQMPCRERLCLLERVPYCVTLAKTCLIMSCASFTIASRWDSLFKLSAYSL